MAHEEIIFQPEILWFDPASSPPDEELRAWWADPSNPENPFSNFIGNKAAVRRLCRAAKFAFGKANRECSDQSFALLGPSSTGKTTLARMFAELLGLPFIEIDSKSAKTINDVVGAIAKVLEDTPIRGCQYETLALQDLADDCDDPKFVVPPCVVFIDEAHNLSDKVEQGLLKAIEKKDRQITCALNTGQMCSLDTSHICWMIATTDRGALFDAFDTRFQKIRLHLYTLDEIAQIVQINNPDWDISICKLVAQYGGRVPREALDFATEMRVESDGIDDSWGNIAARVAEDNEIDPFGMTYQRVDILTALGQGPIAKGNMGSVVDCKEAELVKFVMPALLASTEDQLPLVKITSKGYCITQAGLKELDKRGISYDAELFSKDTRLSTRLNRNTDN